MRSIIMTSILFIAFGLAMNAQKFTLTPQVGFENSKTSINYNELGYVAPLGVQFSPQLSLRLDYKFKQGFGPFIGLSTSRSVILYGFNDIENGMNSFNASNGNLQLRFEAGYQYTTKPIFFKNSSGKNAIQNKSGSCGAYRSGCSKSYSARSGHCQSNRSVQASKMSSKNKGTWLKLQPSVGIGFIPSPQEDVSMKTTGGLTAFEYRAGNWSTALQTGMGFEFGRNHQRLFTIGVNYFTGISNLTEQTVVGESGGKTTAAHLESKSSGWNLRVGIPFSLTKKHETKSKPQYRGSKKGGCCDKYRMQYRIRYGSL